ncbi:hapless 2-like [Harmonia axyridis]|uniref:hapless 2-like n=1 Tax=Harmonia axyridis TaxID=115357 RepID=UPI001E2789C3|nr:hapless 2-like [Harmonia axyridis]
MILQQVTISTLLVTFTICLTKGQELNPEAPEQNLVLRALQPPPVTSPDGVQTMPNNRRKRCGGGGGGCGCGGGCSQPAPAKVYNVHIQVQVKKAPARPPPRMVHRPAQVAYVPVAVVPVQTYHPAPTCCGGGGGGGYGGGGGGGGKGKWGK